MKLFTFSHEFNYSWQSVTTANWRKYPNEMSPQVVHVDILDRKVDMETGILTTERLIACKQPMPIWLQRLFGADSVSYFHEISTVDPSRQTYHAVTRNVSFSNLMTLEERLTYKPDPNDSSKTVLEQEAAFDASAGYSALKNAIEEACVSRFQANAERGRQGLEMVIDKLRNENLIPASL